jgi:transposase
MLSLSPATRIFVALQPIDMRKSFNGLYTLAKEQLQQEPTNGHLFVFTNKLRNRIKILWWDGSGLCLYIKRPEKGTFGWPQGEGLSRTLRPEELQVLIHGLAATPRAHWYRTA